jgi:hypothetical protein
MMPSRRQAVVPPHSIFIYTRPMAVIFCRALLSCNRQTKHALVSPGEHRSERCRVTIEPVARGAADCSQPLRLAYSAMRHLVMKVTTSAARSSALLSHRFDPKLPGTRAYVLDTIVPGSSNITHPASESAMPVMSRNGINDGRATCNGQLRTKSQCQRLCE